ncbi:MAG: PspC domain-containing protein [Chloroflexota bacterium]|nr:MAG: PspC domain-containing protein [Chloroflexota bacterium]
MQVNQNRRLYRCRNDRRIAGVASGVAEFFDLDPTVVRVVWFLSIFFGGLGIFVYIVMALIVPLEPLTEFVPAAMAGAATDIPGVESTSDGAGAGVAYAPGIAPAGHRHAPRQPGRWSLFFGYALVLLGGVALVDAVLPAWDSWRYLWPTFIIGIGAFLVFGALRKEPTEP